MLMVGDISGFLTSDEESVEALRTVDKRQLVSLVSEERRIRDTVNQTSWTPRGSSYGQRVTIYKTLPANIHTGNNTGNRFNSELTFTNCPKLVVTRNGYLHFGTHWWCTPRGWCQALDCSWIYGCSGVFRSYLAKSENRQVIRKQGIQSTMM